MTDEPDLQHVSYAVYDALGTARALCADFGAIPIAGESFDEFRYVLLHVGGEAGGYLELMEPNPLHRPGAGFLHRFLAKHGEGPHHLTWMIPDLEGAVAQARALGFTVVGEDYSAASWEEAFLTPHPVTGCVLQFARSDRDYPSGAEILRGTLPREQLPSSHAALDDDWWVSLLEAPRGPQTPWDGIEFSTSDTNLMSRVFAEILGGNAVVLGGSRTYRWPSGTIALQAGSTSGIQGVRIGGERHMAASAP